MPSLIRICILKQSVSFIAYSLYLLESVPLPVYLIECLQLFLPQRSPSDFMVPLGVQHLSLKMVFSSEVIFSSLVILRTHLLQAISPLRSSSSRILITNHHVDLKVEGLELPFRHVQSLLELLLKLYHALRGKLASQEGVRELLHKLELVFQGLKMLIGRASVRLRL